MRHRLQRRSNLFLMEIILAILFFSIASAVCIRLFARAHVQSEETAALNHAVLIASGAAEALETWDGTPESMEALFPEASGMRTRFWQAMTATGTPVRFLKQFTGCQQTSLKKRHRLRKVFCCAELLPSHTATAKKSIL